ncbi:MAG: hypothetical protein V3U33_03120 [candidate division NC10 bacterium]
MTGEGRKKGKKKKGRKKGKEFMDAAHEAYLRHLVEEIWADLEEVLKTGETLLHEAQWITEFEERGPYKEIWQRAWRTYVPQPLESQSPGAIVLGIEEAVEAAAQEEEAERQRRGDKSFFEEEQYQSFVTDALEKLFREEHGSLEEADETVEGG